MEALTVIQGDTLVPSTREFIFLPTCPREYRAATPTPYLKASCRPQDMQAVRAVTGQTVRSYLQFPVEKMFTPRQMEVIQDELEAPLRTDQITYFSMRPPELLFVDNPINYTRWFIRRAVCPLFDPHSAMKYLRINLDPNVSKSQWIDGFNYQIVARTAAIKPLYDFALSRYRNQTNSHPIRKPSLPILNLLQKIVELRSQTRTTRQSLDELKRLSELFLFPKEQRHLPVVWWTPVYPKRKTAFLVQMLLTEGNFETEYELMLQGNLKSSYRVAGLLNDDDIEGSYKKLMSTFVLRHLRVLHGGSFQFDRNLVEARSALRELYMNEESVALGTPSVLFSTMTQATNEKICDYIKQKRSTLVDAVYIELDKCNLTYLLPERQSILEARDKPLSEQIIARFFPPPKHQSQTNASYEEQTNLMILFKTSVDRYRSSSNTHRNIVTVGGPGVGKTTVAMICTLFCLAIGLNGITTSLVSDRSKELGGIHFHQLISLMGRSDHSSPGRAAEIALASLYRNPEALELLKRLDFINLDELGIFSAENLAIFDMILRYVRGSCLFMGGVFIFCTMDHLQLLPFKGTPILLSMYVITDFTFIRLVESVRAAKDAALREIIRLTRLSSWTQEDRNLFTRLLENNCIFVDSFDDPKIPNDAVFVFGRKYPCRAAETILLERMKSQYSGQYRIVDCYDEESTTGGNWHNASEGTKMRLDRNIKQRRQIVLYPKARFEFTHVLKNKFSQGQLALLLEVPSNDHLLNRRPIELFKAPSGIKYFPPNENCTQEQLTANKWVKITVPYNTTPTEQIGRRLQARRTQYGIKPRISNTIHACMGSTLPAIVTAVVPLKDMPYDFSLWEAAMVVVLLSRTRLANQIFFVGNKKETIQHLLDVLIGNQHRFLRYITDLLHKLCKEQFEVPIIRQPTLFRPKDAIVTSVPGVYLIISMKQPQFSYIGETTSLSDRLQTHNSGRGPDATANFGLLPFAMFAYVVGFEHKGERLHFESLWKVAARRQTELAKTNNGLVIIGKHLVQEHNQQRPDNSPLRIVQCGTVTNS